MVVQVNLLYTFVYDIPGNRWVKGKCDTKAQCNGYNIDGCYMLRPFAHPAVCCWELLRKV